MQSSSYYNALLLATFDMSFANFDALNAGKKGERLLGSVLFRSTPVGWSFRSMFNYKPCSPLALELSGACFAPAFGGDDAEEEGAPQPRAGVTDAIPVANAGDTFSSIGP